MITTYIVCCWLKVACLTIGDRAVCTARPFTPPTVEELHTRRPGDGHTLGGRVRRR